MHSDASIATSPPDTSAPGFSELFTIAVRQVLPQIIAKRLSYSFDVRGPELRISDDASATLAGLHRLLCGAIDLVDIGFLVIDAETSLTRSGKVCVSAKFGGTGRLAPQARIGEVMHRLGLVEPAFSPDLTRPQLRRANGVCPATGAALEFAASPSQGVLFSARWIEPAAQVDPAPPLDVGRARAWVINEDALVGESLVRRLQRLGWATTKFVTPEGAIRQMRTLQPDRARPSLVIGVESRSFDLPAARALRAVLPPWTRCIYAVASGSVSLLLHRDVLAWDVLVRPLSPAQLAQISVEAVPQAEPGSGHTLPAPLSMAQRPRLVVVDDDELNRVVVGGIAQTLGYEVSTAPGGAEGIELCRRRRPEVVLMDLCMQPMDGFETTRRLRGLERAGAIAPCRIVAVTAETQAEVQLECLRAGMDGFVAKPVLAGELSDELRRVFTGCGVAAPMQRDLPAPRTPLETADHIGRRTQAVTTQANPGV